MAPKIANAQFIWQRQATIEHSKWGNSYTSLDCNGDNCTVAGLAELDTAPFVSLLFEHSIDGGKTWTQTLPKGFPEFNDGWHWVVKVQQVDSLTTVVLIDSLAVLPNAYAYVGSLAWTLDGGISWQRIAVPTQASVTDFHFSDVKTGIFITVGNEGQNDSIFTTTDGGSDWTRSYILTPYFLESCHSFGAGKFRVWGAYYGPFYSTLNNWMSWDSSNLANPSRNPTELLHYCSYSGFDTAYCFGVLLQQGAALHRTTDAGKTWTDIPEARDLTIIRYMTSLDRDTIYAAGGAHTPQLLKSTDRGNTWKIEDIICDTDLYHPEIRGITTSASGTPLMILDQGGGIYSYAHIFRGEWEAQGVKETANDLFFKMYPNPATTSINIEAHTNSRRVHLFDILGHEVQNVNLKDGKAQFDVSTLPRGIYSLILDRDKSDRIIGKVVLCGH